MEKIANILLTGLSKISILKLLSLTMIQIFECRPEYMGRLFGRTEIMSDKVNFRLDIRQNFF